MFDLLLSVLNEVHPIPEKLKKELGKRLVRVEYQSGVNIIPKNTVNDRIFFIEKGLVRCYYHKDEKQDLTSWLINEYNFVYVPHSFITQTPSIEAVETLEPCTFVTITYHSLMELYQKYHEAVFLGKVITESYLIMYDERVRSLRMSSAEERHESFRENFPEIYKRAPKKHIASFLGITPETLSRLRKST